MNPKTAATAQGRDLSAPDGETPRKLSLRSVSHAFGPLEALAGIDLEVGRRETVGIVGPSGCGKSTLLELIAGLAGASAGAIEIGSARTEAERLELCAYMPQRDLLLPWLRAIDNAALSPRLEGTGRSEARELARPLFQRLGLHEFEAARPDELSGGMRQRVAFARTLLSGKPVLLLDEPFAALDAITRGDLQTWLIEALIAEPRTTLLVTHDVEEALYICDRVLVLSPRPGRVVWEAGSPRPAAASRAEVVTAPSFIDCREQALRALGGS